MALLSWIPFNNPTEQSMESQPRFIRNISGRYESRFVSVKIQPSPAIMLRKMAGSTLGIWVAHGEGRAHFPSNDILEKVESLQLAPLRYVDDGNNITETYPFNPNGSIRGIAALCSPYGRHLALMPHPERTFLKWQWPWIPFSMHSEIEVSPWLQLFQNARFWCDNLSLQ